MPLIPPSIALPGLRQLPEAPDPCSALPGPRLWPGLMATVLAAFLLLSAPARADITVADVQVAARALSFVTDPPSGRLRLGVVYAPGNSRSLQEAERLRDLLRGGYRVGSVELVPVLVESGRAAGADVDLYFLTSHLSPAETPDLLPARGSPSSRNRRICLTIDIAQVQNGRCTVGVRSQPRVEVLVNQASAAACGIQFSTAFRVMITEI
jgi:hypothetical protein